ncbi:MAG: sigma-54-dependent Fis family transcriptional regulator [Calditrichaeota bacterium]|nr:MAG: sigma-54-dependent Fis family transcriptional regulator [Calditrichota bacterium]
MKLLVVDDERSLRVALADELADAGYTVETAATGEEALEWLNKEDFDLVICDLVLDGISGEDVLDYMLAHSPQTRFLLITANATLESAIKILKKGAIDYICKPFDIEHLLRIISNVEETIRLRQENEALRARLYQKYQFSGIIGKSPAMQKVFQLLDTVCQTDVTVLLIGDTGTGKGLIAETIHYNSPRRDKPFVTVSCAALSRELLESELFGHEKGAFTGAIRQKKGRFELANGGTLFLDEVDDIPPETQVKLLQVIESGKFERVGGEETLQVDVRLIAATKKDLQEEMAAGHFRRDLFYRLNVMPIYLPPLRERKEDIPLLVEHFLKKYSPDKPLKLSSEIMELLLEYEWDGNVRELENVIERLVVLGQQGDVDTSFLPPNILNLNKQRGEFEWGKITLPDYLHRLEKAILEEALIRCQGSKTRMAQELGIPLPTLKSKLKKYQLF